MKTARIATFVALAALACQQDARQQEGPTALPNLIRDSAGIRITENARPPEGSRLPWRIGPEPMVSIGELEGEEPYMLHQVFQRSQAVRWAHRGCQPWFQRSASVRRVGRSPGVVGRKGRGTRRIPEPGERRSWARRLDRGLVLAGGSASPSSIRRATTVAPSSSGAAWPSRGYVPARSACEPTAQSCPSPIRRAPTRRWSISGMPMVDCTLRWARIRTER